MFFNSNLKYLIDTNKITQSQLAERLNIKRQQLGRYVKDGQEPKYKYLIAICYFFKIPIDDMLTKDLSK